MQAVRHLLAQRHFTLLICVGSLLVKLLVPTGYMIDSNRGRIVITICSGTAPRTMTMEMPDVHGDVPDRGQPKEHGKAEMPCAFSGLSAAMPGAIDPVQLAALIVFILAFGLIATVPSAPSRLAYLRPPPRGPPAYR